MIISEEGSMALKLISYINFNGNAREAAEFYQSVFGGELQMSTFADYESEEMLVDEADKNKIMHAFLKGDNGIQLMLSDTPAYMEFQEGSRITLALNTDNEAEGRALWDKLTDGGAISMELQESMWDSIFGMFTDKFGVHWMLDIGEMQE